MRNRFYLAVAFYLLLATPSSAQEVHLPRDPDKLIERVQAFWNAVTSGQRVQAAEFVLPEKKNVYLSGNPVPVTKAKVLGIDLTPDRDTATVRIGISVLGTDLSSGGQANWTISDPWIWRRGNWYIDVQDASQIFPEARPLSKVDEKKIQDSLNQNFEILSNPVSLGKLVNGQHFSVEVPIKYSGEFPISIEPALLNPIISMPVLPPITSASKSLVFLVGTDDWEGPFDLPVVLNLKYRNVTVERRLTVTGEVVVPLAFRQDPPNGPIVEGQEFSVFVRNNTDEEIRVRYFTVDGKLDAIKSAKIFPAHQETQMTFRLRPGVAPPDEIFFQLESRVGGRDGHSYRLRNVRP